MSATANQNTSEQSVRSHRRIRHPGNAVQSRESQIELHAENLLRNHHQLQGLSRYVDVRCVGNCLVLGGCLPSWFLKQVVQEAVREIDSIEVVNKILVDNRAWGKATFTAVDDTRTQSRTRKPK